MKEFDSEYLDLPEPNLIIAHDFPDRAMVSPIDTIHPRCWWLSNKPAYSWFQSKMLRDSMFFSIKNSYKMYNDIFTSFYIYIIVSHIHSLPFKNIPRESPRSSTPWKSQPVPAHPLTLLEEMCAVQLLSRHDFTKGHGLAMGNVNVLLQLVGLREIL